MFSVKKIKGTNIIKFVINQNATNLELEGFCRNLELLSIKEDFKLIGVLANFKDPISLKELIEFINTNLRYNEGLLKLALITDRKNIKPILLNSEKCIPMLPFEVFEMEEEQQALKWINSESESSQL